MSTGTTAGSTDVSRTSRDLLIGGKAVPGASRPAIDVINPSDGSVIAQVADATPAEAITAVDAARTAMTAWKKTAPRARAEILRRCFDLIIEREDELAHLLALENGKALTDAHGEVAYTAEFFRWYSEEAVRTIGTLTTAPSGANKILVQHEPSGVAVLVTPWNFPAAMATRKIAPALAAGCSVVLKPAPQTPLTAYAIADILAEAGVPDGVVNVVTTSTAGDVVSAMVHDPRVRIVSFTGSTAVGRSLLREAADHVLKCAMELGGNAPLLVLADADLDTALDGAMVAKMRNGGQACTAANRSLVHRSLVEPVTTELAARMSQLVMGAGTDAATQCGPLIDDAAVTKVSGLVGDALDRGARLITGGTLPGGPGSFYPPTVLTDVPRDAGILREEIFGPVAAIVPFDTDEEAIAAANDTEHGLSAYVFSADLAHGLKVAERLESGMVAINRGLLSDPAAPFGGTKQSGLGREGAREGLLEFTESKYIAVSW
ncbi:NAD-dependent succinate-semialdehyde dehydrogenase [Streptomyces spinosisporus]|uniref:NAD-dependent succinate-semialdehyde dehydrogenase n=1 Tax=Streptomyces spinosisporus TaxID=2927582 RepID=A0ABS9XVW4_9ACTN|nr:NAD-dependent succinate-semialdehyde dehydrogenase [Streptomyces spinosisporus]MCI3245737.1 NAD-dependent succinate-semialdehyde dehydrogenase [Streptomyces spinosisporus]